MSDNLLEFRDLITPTDFKMLFFRPFVRLKVRKLFEAMYSNKLLAEALVNVYPCAENDSNDIDNGHCFLVFDNRKVAKCIEDYKNVIMFKGMQGLSNLSTSEYSVIVYQLPDSSAPIISSYLEGNYKGMFPKSSLARCHRMFRCPVGKGIALSIKHESSVYDLSYHILTFSPEYEKYRAKDLGVPYEKFKGSTKQHKSPPDIEQERLSIEIINNQK